MRESFGLAGLLSVLICGPIGCTITDSATVLVGSQRAAIDVGEVRLYRAAPPKYEEIAMLTAKAGHDFKNDQSLMDSAIQRLKEDAAKLGQTAYYWRMSEAEVGALRQLAAVKATTK